MLAPFVVVYFYYAASMSLDKVTLGILGHNLGFVGVRLSAATDCGYKTSVMIWDGQWISLLHSCSSINVQLHRQYHRSVPTPNHSLPDSMVR